MNSAATASHFRLLLRSGYVPGVGKQKAFRSVDASTPPIFNEAKIHMIDRRLQKQIFKRQTNYDSKQLPKQLAANFQAHKINIDEYQSSNKKTEDQPLHFDLPRLDGENIDDHFKSIALAQSAEYVAQADRLADCSTPVKPSKWIFQEGWTRYNPDGTSRSVPCPEEDSIIFDVEVVLLEGPRPSIAVAVTPEAWYSWTSECLVRTSQGKSDGSSSPPSSTCELPELISLYSNKEESQNVAKCVVGHFVSFDRARIREEYSIKGTRARFLDTMALHMAICGLTGTQRMLKTRVNKNQFKNKVWRNYVEERSRFSRSPSDDLMMKLAEEEDSNGDDGLSMAWLSVSSLDNLVDVYRHHCGRKPPQSKEKRNDFISGTSLDVAKDFQNLMTYCATDVSMTHEVFQKVWPAFKKKFSHPVSIAGILEMSTACLPINENWLRYIDKAEETYQKIRQSQKDTLMKLADRALLKAKDEEYKNDSWLWDLDWSTTRKTKASENYYFLPKWYRELIEKPLKNNIDKGPSTLTLQTRITPKLLRLSWNGLPLHHDMVEGWGYLMPGRDPDVNKDPMYYDELGHVRRQILVERVGSGKVPTRRQMVFPYGSIVEVWSRRLAARLAELQDSLSQSDNNDREGLNEGILLQDARLMEELRNSCEVLPLEGEEKERLMSAFHAISILIDAEKRILGTNKRGQELTDIQMNQLLCDLQVRGRDFWLDEKRYSTRSSLAKQTKNPLIPTCWFCHLPHKEGQGHVVGNPLTKPFLRFIADGQLRSQYGDDADILLRRQIHCSYWQSTSKRVKEQIFVWLDDDEFESENLMTGRVGLILPQIKVMGTVTRRAVEKTWLTASNAYRDRVGSELKAMVQSPPGYSFVGADVDSQELWIAATLGDATVGVQGGTPFGWMVLRGSRSEGTDLHTVTSSMIGISRDSAKVLNYARLYGAGQAYSAQLLQQFNPSISLTDAKQMARRLMEQTKGCRETTSNGRVWRGGTESATFNRLEEIAQQPQPKTPVLGAELTQALNPRLVGQDFMTSRVNWVVQSSAVDYLHCMLVCMRWLTDRYKIPARFAISIHDEVRYLVQNSATDRAALALQITNLLTRALFVSKLGMEDLPESVAFFSGVEIDRCIRKEPSDDCATPSNEEGLHRNYNLPPGESIDMAETLRRTGGRLEP